MVEIFTLVLTVVVIIVIVILTLIKSLTIVPPNEVHVLSGGRKPIAKTARYFYFPLLYKRTILSKSVMEVSIPQIQLHDKNYLPFAVQISCKVQISDPIKASETFVSGSPAEIKPIVDDTIQSAARSQAMLQELVIIMRDRDTIEEAIYSNTTQSLSRIGIKVTLFDIKNIIDVPNSTVIKDLERKQSSLINKEARIAEAEQRSLAEIYEAEKISESEVRKQVAFQKSEEARYKQEQYIAEQRKELTLREMEVLDADTRRKQEIEKDRTLIEATAQAEKTKMEAEAAATAKLIAAEAEAKSIQLKLEAEAAGTEKLAEALKKLDEGGAAIKLAEIYADAQKIVSENVARGIQNNSKLFLPMGGSNSILDLIPSIEAMKIAGTSLADVLKSSKDKK